MIGRPHPFRFVALLVALSIPFYVVGALLGGIHIGALSLPASAVMVPLPGLVALLLVRLDDRGGRAIGAFLRLPIRCADRRLRWTVVSLTTMPAITVLSSLLLRGFGTSDALWTGLNSPPAYVALVAVMLVAATCEELGWSAYLARGLLGVRGVLATGLIVGSVWAVWHSIPLVQVGHSTLWLVGWTATTMGARVLMVWLYVASRYTLVYPIVFHAMINVCAALSPTSVSDAGSLTTGGIVLAVAAVVTLRAGARVASTGRR